MDEFNLDLDDSGFEEDEDVGVPNPGVVAKVYILKRAPDAHPLSELVIDEIRVFYSMDRAKEYLQIFNSVYHKNEKGQPKKLNKAEGAFLVIEPALEED